MVFELELKPHGKLKADHTKGIYIDREPKGNPDIIFVSDEQKLPWVYKAADILSVQGYTARILCAEDFEKFSKQDKRYRKELFSDVIPCIFLVCCEDVDKYFTSKVNSFNELDSNEIARIGRNLILEQKKKQI